MFFDILGQTIQIFTSSPSLIIYPILATAISFTSSFILTALGKDLGLYAGLILIPLQIVLAIVSVMATVANAYIVVNRAKGVDVSLTDGFTIALERFWKIASFMGLLILVAVVLAIIVSLMTAIPALACFIIVPVIGITILSLGTMLAPVVIGVEDIGGLAAYHRSAKLVNNTKSVIVLLFIFSFIIGFVIAFVLLNSISTSDIEMMQRTGTYTGNLGVFGNVFFQFVVSVLSAMFSSIFTAIWYLKAVEKVDSPTL